MQKIEVRVIKSQPESLKDCDNLMFTNNCNECTFYEKYAPVSCKQRKAFYTSALKLGEIVEYGDEFKYIDTCKKCEERC